MLIYYTKTSETTCFLTQFSSQVHLLHQRTAGEHGFAMAWMTTDRALESPRNAIIIPKIGKLLHCPKSKRSKDPIGGNVHP